MILCYLWQLLIGHSYYQRYDSKDVYLRDMVQAIRNNTDELINYVSSVTDKEKIEWLVENASINGAAKSINELIKRETENHHYLGRTFVSKVHYGDFECDDSIKKTLPAPGIFNSSRHWSGRKDWNNFDSQDQAWYDRLEYACRERDVSKYLEGFHDKGDIWSYYDKWKLVAEKIAEERIVERVKEIKEEIKHEKSRAISHDDEKLKIENSSSSSTSFDM